MCSSGAVVEELVVVLALINGRIMELVRLPCPATRIHQPDNSGHVTPGINWTGPQIEFWAKERRAQKRNDSSHTTIKVEMNWSLSYISDFSQ